MSFNVLRRFEKLLFRVYCMFDMVFESFFIVRYGIIFIITFYVFNLRRRLLFFRYYDKFRGLSFIRVTRLIYE